MSDPFRNDVLEVYDTVADQSKWTQVLDKLCERIDARGCIVFGWETVSGSPRLVAPHQSSFYKKDIVTGYIERHWRDEERDQAIFREHSLTADRIEIFDDTVLAPNSKELARLPNVKALRQFGIHNRAISLLNKDDTNQSRFSIQLSESRGRLSGSDRRHLENFLPHVAKALELGRPALTLQRENQTLLEAMNRLKIGLCLVDGRGQVVARNLEFLRQQEEVGVFSTQSNGRLQLNDVSNSKRFELLLADALNHGQFGARPRKEALSADLDHYLCVEIVPANKVDAIGSGALGGYFVYSTDTSRGVEFDLGSLKDAYSLTDTELALLSHLGEGLTNAEIAQRRGRAVATINVQVKSILFKTQCSNRTQLVRLLMNFGANYL